MSENTISKIKIRNIEYVLDDTKSIKYTEQNLTDEQKTQAKANLGLISAIEPSDDDIPRVFIDGVIPTTKNDVKAKMQYISKTENFNAYLNIKCQGDSSMAYPKKNFTIKMYSDEARETKLKRTFKDWNHESNKYVLKANYIDHTHARNIVSANMWSQTIASRSDYDTLPEELRNSPRNGAIDGFPIKVYANGVYQGIYTWNIGKDDWMWGMNEDNPNHILLCAETNDSSENPCNFNALWSGTDGEHWSIEVGANSDSVKNSLNALITCVKDTDDETFRNTIGTYLDIQSAIDYVIHQSVICGSDGVAKNMLLATYDGTKWYCGAYDMDASMGLYADGLTFESPTVEWPWTGQNAALWTRIKSLFAEELLTRYSELRNTVYSRSSMITRFERFTGLIGEDLYAEDLEIYEDIPQGDQSNIKQIRTFIYNRLAYLDDYFGLIDGRVVYSISDTSLDGTEYVDTGVKLGNYSTYTVMLDYTRELDFTNDSVNVVLDNQDLHGGYNGWLLRYGSWDTSGQILACQLKSPDSMNVHNDSGANATRKKIAIVRGQDGSTFVFTDDRYPSGLDISTIIADTGGDANESLIVGANRGAVNEYYGYTKMTIHKLEIFDTNLSDNTILKLLQS